MFQNELARKAKEKLIYFGRYKNNELKLNDEAFQQLDHLNKFGYVKLKNPLSAADFEQLRMCYQSEIEKKLNFETPCLAQNKINPQQHKTLIDNYLRYSPQEYEKQGIAFTKSDISSYQQILEDFRPSTLKTYIPHSILFFNLWLHPTILNIVEAYMGLRPYLVEAYLRRNFPADYKVMNHFWHRDTNHKNYLLKAFIFFSDCEIYHGPHEYIASSIDDNYFQGKPYYSDEEIDQVYPSGHSNRIISTVKAGTLILEDTRGLHRARVPEKSYRDLGYAVFFPRNIFYRRSRPHFSIDANTYAQLNKRQKSFILPENIIQ